MKTLYRQFIQTSGWFFVLSLVLGIVLTNVYYLSFTKQQTTEQNLERAEEIVSTLEQMHGDATSLAPFLQSVANLGYQLVLDDGTGNLLSFGKPFSELALTDEASRVATEGSTYLGEDSNLSFFMTSHFANRLTNTVGVPFEVDGEQYGLFLRPDLSLLSSDIHTLLLAFLVSIAVVNLAGMLWMAKQLTKPIGLLQQATEEVANDNYSHAIPTERSDEIGKLTESFNQMIERLRENDAARKTFITNVSHDLQSPLLNIQGYAEQMKQTLPIDSESVQHAKIIQQEALRLSVLAKQLLLLSSLDQPSYQLKKETYSLDSQLKRIVSHCRWRLEEKELELSFKLPPTLVTADQELLDTVWDNLLTNAIKYSHVGDSLSLAIHQDDSFVNVHIQDSGIGISAEDLPRITERFYRADPSRHEEGTGLGLAIVEEIIKRHGGTTTIESTLEEGTTVLVRLPK